MVKEEFPLQKVTLHLYKGDFARLRELEPDLGASKLVRLLVREYINDQRENRNRSSARA